MKPLYTQTLNTPNAKVMCIASICKSFLLPPPPSLFHFHSFQVEENRFDLFVGLTDRRVAVYHWSHEASSFKWIRTFSVSGQVTSMALAENADSAPHNIPPFLNGTENPKNAESAKIMLSWQKIQNAELAK